jgi:hypothetical protein
VVNPSESGPPGHSLSQHQPTWRSGPRMLSPRNVETLSATSMGTTFGPTTSPRNVQTLSDNGARTASPCRASVKGLRDPPFRRPL